MSDKSYYVSHSSFKYESGFSEEVRDKDYSGKVAAMSKVLENLRGNIAEAIRPLIPSKKNNQIQ